MARKARSLGVAGALSPGSFYHITNRGVDRGDIFRSDLDRVVFLSMLAEACDRFGAACHAWCLMSNHFHLVVEDARGVLPQLLHRLESCYARYFNDSRRRTGPLFEHRYADELIDSADYFQDACAYVLLNPVRTQVPLAQRAEDYAWSSARLVASETTAAEVGASLLERVGGAVRLLATLPKPRRRSTRELREARVAALAAGRWMEREAVLAGRTPEQYRQMLEARSGRSPIAADDRESDLLGRHRADTPDNERAGSGSPEPRVATQPAWSRLWFGGVKLDEVRETIERVCSEVAAVSLAGAARAAEVVAYELYRFTSAGAAEVAEVVGVSIEHFEDTLRAIRRAVHEERSWQQLTWRVEWALRWRLRAGPHRA